MDKTEFRRKLILSLVEKGLIAIIVALVGYWINMNLKKLDHDNNIELAFINEKLEGIEREYKLYRDSITNVNENTRLELNARLTRRTDSLNMARIEDYQQFMNIQQNNFKKYQDSLQRKHEKELSRMEMGQQKEINAAYLELKSTWESELEKIRSELQLTNSVSIRSIEKVSEIWNMIYEFDFLSDELLANVEAFDTKLRPTTSISNSDKSATIIGYKYQDMVKKKNRYNKLKKDLEYVLKTQRFWLTEEAFLNIQNYMNCIDIIQSKTCIDKFKFIPYRKKDASLIDRSEYEILLEQKVELQKNVFDEIKNAL